MTDWAKRRAECNECRGRGYVYGELWPAYNGNAGHEPSWVARCKCQPQTMPEMEEAARQELANHPAVVATTG